MSVNDLLFQSYLVCALSLLQLIIVILFSFSLIFRSIYSYDYFSQRHQTFLLTLIFVFFQISNYKALLLQKQKFHILTWFIKELTIFFLCMKKNVFKITELSRPDTIYSVE